MEANNSTFGPRIVRIASGNSAHGAWHDAKVLSRSEMIPDALWNHAGASLTGAAAPELLRASLRWILYLSCEPALAGVPQTTDKTKRSHESRTACSAGASAVLPSRKYPNQPWKVDARFSLWCVEFSSVPGAILDSRLRGVMGGLFARRCFPGAF